MRIRISPPLVLLALTLTGCVAVNPQPTQNERASAVNVELGMGYLRQKNYELASEKLNKALQQDPDSAPAHNAYAMLQEVLLQKDKAEYHYRRATELNPKDSQAANNYGAFLCRNGRELESEKYFLRALDNPLYKTPEFAYTNAAICLLKIERDAPAKEYLRTALAAKSDFAPALLAMGDLLFNEGEYQAAKIYIDRYHRVSRPSARSLWLAIRNELELGGDGQVGKLAQQLEADFPDSEEYRAWLRIQ